MSELSELQGITACLRELLNKSRAEVEKLRDENKKMSDTIHGSYSDTALAIKCRDAELQVSVLEKTVIALRDCYEWDRSEYQSSHKRVERVEEALAKLDKQNTNDTRTDPGIKEAAIMGSQEVPWVGASHTEILKDMTTHGEALPITGEQGFITYDGDFVSREEAAKIAFKAGQIPKEKLALFSEDLRTD